VIGAQPMHERIMIESHNTKRLRYLNILPPFITSTILFKRNRHWHFALQDACVRDIFPQIFIFLCEKYINDYYAADSHSKEKSRAIEEIY
jgi:hypothetical protein